MPDEPHTDGAAGVIAISGASGLLGSMLCRRLIIAGYRVLRLVRRTPTGPDEAAWDPQAGAVDTSALAGASAVIHLAGVSISGLWTPAYKRAIRVSRVDGTATLARALAAMDRPPTALICASATGYYGDRGDEVLTEADGPGRGFLAGVCRDWEQAALPATAAGIRVLHARLGVVLSDRGGALPRLHGLFRRGLGAVLGSGRQYLSWIAAEDAVAGLQFLAEHPTLAGAVNLTAPLPVTNAELTAALREATGQRGLPAVPAWLLRLAPGGMGAELLLASQRALPARLLDAGFQFAHPHLAEALTAALNPPDAVA